MLVRAGIASVETISHQLAFEFRLVLYDARPVEQSVFGPRAGMFFDKFDVLFIILEIREKVSAELPGHVDAKL